MSLSKILKNTFLVIIFGLVVTACATKKTTTTTQIGRAHVWTPVTGESRMPSSAWKKKKNDTTA